MLVTACHEDISKEDRKGDFNVDKDFDWATLQRKQVEVKESSSVYQVKPDGEKVLVANNLRAGSYPFTVAKGSNLEIVPVAPARSLSRVEGDAKSYFPSENDWATMLFEDVFPFKGDMDMNDVVFYYNLEYELDGSANQNVKSLTVRIDPAALGGKSFSEIGLAMQFTGLKNFLTGVKIEGQDGMSGSMFQLESDGVESGTTNTIPLIGNLYNCLENGANGIVNTYPNLSHLSARMVSVKVIFDEENMPQLFQLQLEPEPNGQNMIDLFVTLGERGREVHLKGHPQTVKVADEFNPTLTPKSFSGVIFDQNGIKLTLFD